MIAPEPEPEIAVRRLRIDAAGVGLVVDDHPGDGSRATPALVLHGFTGTAASMAPVLSALVGRRRIAPDLVGHGRSDAPTGRAGYSIPAIVEQLTAVLDTLDVHTVDLVGYSMGGRIALATALALPGRVQRLVTIGANPGIIGAAERNSRAASDDALADRIERDGVGPFVDHWEALPIFATQRHLPDDVRAAVRAERLAHRAQGLANSLRMSGAGHMTPMWGHLPELAPPLLAIAGGLDAPYVAIADRMASLVPAGRSAVIDGAGHAAHIEAPGPVGEAIVAFCDAPDGGADDGGAAVGDRGRP